MDVKNTAGMTPAMHRANGLGKTLKFPLKELVVAPMVDQSELAFRMLCRKYGAKLCYSPMLHSRLFDESPAYRDLKLTTCEKDRPLIVQFCGNNRDVLLSAARKVENMCDAVDINLGCPQGIAKRGRYGSFLLEEWDLLSDIVSHLSKNLSIPVTCKIRLLTDDDESVSRTLQLAKLLESSGCSLLTVHGRTKEQKGRLVGSCDWAAIGRIKSSLSIPVIANGGIGTWIDFQECLKQTKADGVMSSEALLENPTLVAGMEKPPSPFGVALDYIDLAEKYSECSKILRAHLFKFLYGPFKVHHSYRDRIAHVRSKGKHGTDYAAFREIVLEMKKFHDEDKCTLLCCKAQSEDSTYPWYDRHLQRNSGLYGENGSLVSDEAKGFEVEELSRKRIVDDRAERKKRKIHAKALAVERKVRRL